MTDDINPFELLHDWEVASILGIGEYSVRELAKSGKLGYIKITRCQKRFTMELIKDFLESQTVRASDPGPFFAEKPPNIKDLFFKLI